MQLHRRLIDLVAATAGILIMSPLFALIAIAVKIDDGGPVFYRQERVGRGGKSFLMWKFRTMVKDADKQGPLLTVGRDKRVTRVGTVLRKTKLDELPQLLNVIIGEMTFVGPRPEVQRYVDLYTLEQRRVLALVPGITDEASIKYRHESDVLGRSEDPERTYVEEIMAEKIRINLAYAERSTVASDLRVILKTVAKILV